MTVATSISTTMPANGPLIIELIHIDSPISPFHNHSVELAKAAERNGDDSILSVSVPWDGTYLLKLSIGTPPVKTYAVMGTGSNLTWLQCAPCRNCYLQLSPPFDPSKLATYCNMSCNSAACQAVTNPSCDVSSGMCQYISVYAVGASSSGILATDTLAFDTIKGKGAAFASSVFGCGFDNQICYQFKNGVSVAVKKITSNPKMGSEDKIIIDSGTSNTYLNVELYKQVEAAVKDVLGIQEVPDLQHQFSLCYETQSFGTTPELPFEFHFGGAAIALNKQNIFLEI